MANTLGKATDETRGNQKHNLYDWPNPNRKIKEKITLKRLRIARTKITHNYLTTKEEPPQCKFYDVSLTIKHMLTKCCEYIKGFNEFNIPTNIVTK